MTLRCALLELNWYHDEVLLTFVRLLNELGIAPDVYVPVRAAEKDVFALDTSLRYRLFLTDGTAAPARLRRKARGSPSRFRRYDLVILNSVEPEWIIEEFAAKRTPTLAVMHNADLLETDDRYARYFASAKRRPLFLARHIAEHMGDDSATSWIAPFHYGGMSFDATHPERTGTVMCVQGLDSRRRNVSSVLEALSAVAGDRPELLVEFVGRADPRTLAAFEEEVERRGLGQYVSATGADLRWKEYVAAVARADFALSLVDRGADDYAPYYAYKLTSSLSWPIGLGVVPIVEAELSELYGIGHASVRYETGGLAGALRRALALGPEERRGLRSGLEQVREAAMVRSRANLVSAIEAVVGSRSRN